ncbi:MAG TPA: DUF4411 family protein [Mycobacteriales bacterium]|jgi:hypothetical protein|nr:DUF4411 family protein [Mycobacteriales bacterium]
MHSFDTSSLLNGRRDLLPPAVFRSVWEKVERSIVGGEVRAVEVVRDELARRDDDVFQWAKAQDGLFMPLTEDVQQATSEVLRAHARLTGVGGGRNHADPFVIGLAMVHGGTVVTEETKRGNLESPRIPDVCEALGVPCVNLVGFITSQGWSF